MNKSNHILVLDPITYSGGSKIATREMLDLLNRKNNRVTILTANPSSWLLRNVEIIKMSHPNWLPVSEYGKSYWTRQLYFCFWLFYARLFYGKIDVAVGASGPGIDMPIYIMKCFLGYQITQLIHGPVGLSRSIGLCLCHAEHVFYLQSTYPSLLTALKQVWRKDELSVQTAKQEQLFATHHFESFVNGIAKKNRPSACQYQSPSLFWAASLLKWKGLDLLLETTENIPTDERIPTNICYLTPENNVLPTTRAPRLIESITWHHQPSNLDTLRAQANIFVSTSHQEPFGLSILEALMAGMCVIIPSDGAFWDLVLTHNKNCLKYQPNDISSLQLRISQAGSDLNLITQLGQSGAHLSQGYQAEKCYLSIKFAMEKRPLAALALNEVKQ
ncbi:glycosyltransferase family 4 protein [Aliivibrio sp. S3MY1]|uniref:glycosyltransferase family 4 protein n=1 Tax=unclassified Aliivibrio TaxID=2645654 RepID=UPI002377D96B|nr:MULTISPECIES: glycosyltransferase family 4 protein [unclassified Aliivibrio]MDD9194447.1 glycosyltransferase family 4 protein [Aliivibrio sp. S3MY1]MDD9198214.1 glycosyltransferase family 4 protein [Aliivibrio sp. S2MY1]